MSNQVDRTPSTEPDLSVVVAFYNERDGVDHLVSTLERLDAQDETRIEFVLVDDGSEDGTAEALRARWGERDGWRLLQHPRNRGFGAAFRTGAEACAAPLIACYDFDCTYPVEDVLTMRATLLAQDADLVTASPFQPGGEVVGLTLRRLIQSRAASELYRLALGRGARGIHTFSCAFRVYRRDALLSLPPWSDRFLAASEIIANALAAGQRVIEVPSVLTTRQFGVSKLRALPTTIAHLRMIARLGLRRIATRALG